MTEAECYTRLYGDRESAVTVIREGDEAQQAREQLRGLFEDDAEPAADLPAAEAA